MFSVLLLVTLLGCGNSEPPPSLSFYHWQSYLDLTTEEDELLLSVGTKRLYVRYFDIDFQGGKPVPVGVMIPRKGIRENMEIIPTIFITEKTMRYVSNEQLEELLDNVIRKINGIHSKVSPTDISEVQFDCDWTAGSRERFFLFLKKMKEKTTWKISATIRLHQWKYPSKTGVPPVDRGVLMVYNTGKVSDKNEENSILDMDDVRSYLPEGEYDIPLDVALPLFRWAVLFRDGKMIRLIHSPSLSELSDTSRFSKRNHWTKVIKSTYLNGYYLYEGDELRIEEIDRGLLMECAQMIKPSLNAKEIVFYHLDTTITKTYSHETLENIGHIFSH